MLGWIDSSSDQAIHEPVQGFHPVHHHRVMLNIRRDIQMRWHHAATMAARRRSDAGRRQRRGRSAGCCAEQRDDDAD